MEKNGTAPPCEKAAAAPPSEAGATWDLCERIEEGPPDGIANPSAAAAAAAAAAGAGGEPLFGEDTGRRLRPPRTLTGFGTLTAPIPVPPSVPPVGSALTRGCWAEVGDRTPPFARKEATKSPLDGCPREERVVAVRGAVLEVEAAAAVGGGGGTWCHRGIIGRGDELSGAPLCNRSLVIASCGIGAWAALVRLDSSAPPKSRKKL